MIKKKKKRIYERIAYRRFLHDLKRQKLKKEKRRKQLQEYYNLLDRLGGKINEDSVFKYGTTANIKYILQNENSPLYAELLLSEKKVYDGVFYIPEIFSLTENPDESYAVIRSIFAALIRQYTKEIIIDYRNCKRITLDAQVFLDIILKDVIHFYKFCNQIPRYQTKVVSISGRALHKPEIESLLYSVGSPAIHNNKTISYPNVIPYNLCVHKAEGNRIKQLEQKDLDTTELALYVIQCLKRMGRTLDSDARDHLCTIIGETLINAEEHSSTRYRYSIGYFKEVEINGEHVGRFQLVIMNLGRTIYEKFHDPDCPNQSAVENMKKLSAHYTKNRFLMGKDFEEETLWTLYALQDGVTSVSPSEYANRGNGSLRFVESFFNLKGNDKNDSHMYIQSGHTNILFDGTYHTSEQIVNGKPYRVMTFNESGDINDKPNVKYVRRTETYFPGTFIYANLLIK